MHHLGVSEFALEELPGLYFGLVFVFQLLCNFGTGRAIGVASEARGRASEWSPWREGTQT